MKTTEKKIKIKDLLKGFTYDQDEGKGLYGMDGKLTIQPEFQRYYVYADKEERVDGVGKDQLVIMTLLEGMPLGGAIYLNAVEDENGNEKYEVIDGQQRLTSIGRFMSINPGWTFSVEYDNNMMTYTSLDKDFREKMIDNAELNVYICKGTEAEVKKWFERLNVAGVKLTAQELRNATYSGPFVTSARKHFSNTLNPKMKLWSKFIKGNPKRQDYLEEALIYKSGAYIAKSKKEESKIIEDYMAKNRHNDNSDELEEYFEEVIEKWSLNLFDIITKEMKGLNWGLFYNRFHKKKYNKKKLNKRVHELLEDPAVHNKKNVYEFVLNGEKPEDRKLLEIRLFDAKTQAETYSKQTRLAKKKGISNCPDCVLGETNNKTKIWTADKMKADHVTAYFNDGKTTPENCQMLCSHHNLVKGNVV